MYLLHPAWVRLRNLVTTISYPHTYPDYTKGVGNSSALNHTHASISHHVGTSNVACSVELNVLPHPVSKKTIRGISGLFHALRHRRSHASLQTIPTQPAPQTFAISALMAPPNPALRQQVIAIYKGIRCMPLNPLFESPPTICSQLADPPPQNC